MNSNVTEVIAEPISAHNGIVTAYSVTKVYDNGDLEVTNVWDGDMGEVSNVCRNNGWELTVRQ